MATAVTTRMSDNLGKAMSSPQTKSSKLKTEDNQQQVPSIIQPDEKQPGANSDKKDSAVSTTNAPLAPPPRPSQNNESNNQEGQKPEGKDYFSKEPNPFENAFGAPSDTPGKPQLPGVTSLTSPAPLLGGTTPGWPGSLRSGPLSPAMLTGPTSNDYFNSDHHFAGSFPTPNESSLRTGLTPGGGGSMFPQPSPSSQAMFNAIQSGGATPGTLDFHRTAMHARAASHHAQGNNDYNSMAPNTSNSQPQDPNIQPNLDGKGFAAPGNQPNQRDQFEQHDANDAANGLYMLAQARNGQQNQAQQYPPPQQASSMNYMPNAQHMQNPLQQNDTSPTTKRGGKPSVVSNMSGSTQNDDAFSESGASDAKPSARGKGKKGSAAKGNAGRRKAEDTPVKGSNKRQKGNNGAVNPPSKDDEPDDSDMEDGAEETGENGRKLTDEEKRKNFLERNRIAALKCRQRKKQWLANLQQKVEIYGSENDALAATVTQLREEIVGLKTLLLAHKDCPVSQAQGISGMAMQNIAGDAQQYGNPYSMGMGQGMGQHGMPPQANMRGR